MSHSHEDVTIMVVDDNHNNRLLLQMILSKEGYDVLLAESAGACLEMLSDHQVSLLLLDIMMPGMNGFELTNKLRADSRFCDIPFMFITAMSDTKSKLNAFQLGAVDYITKPFQPDEVVARVRVHIRLSMATRALIDQQAARLSELKQAQNEILVEPSSLPEAKFGVFYQSLFEVGGDFYDVIEIADEIHSYFVGDISGHDIATGFITPAVHALLRQNCTPAHQPLESMQLMNKVLTKVLPVGKYLTACFARLNRARRSLTIVSMGHPPVLFIPKSGEARLLEIEGDLLGPYEDAQFGVMELKVEEGDRFILYSDGLVESASVGRVWSGAVQELIQKAQKLEFFPIEEVPTVLVAAMDAAGAEMQDDVVVVGVEV